MKTKGDEVFNRIAHRDDFQKAIRNCRTRFAIPADGMKERVDIRRWFASIGRNYGLFLGELGDIQLSFKLSQGFINRLESYVISGDTKKPFPIQQYAFAEMDSNGTIAERNRKNNKPFASLLIYEHATRTELRRLLNKSWSNIQNDIERQRGSRTSQIRRSKFDARDQEILNLYEMPRKDLMRVYEKYCSELGLKRMEYKHIIVSRIIGKKYRFIDPDHVKKIIWKMRKMRQGDL